jgi:predicted outer membrane lipoprotein
MAKADSELMVVTVNMTLRDWLAGQALGVAFGVADSPSEIARCAYAIADAMMLERDKK